MNVLPDPTLIRRAAEWLDDARSVLFVTGAGMSADSGLPTHRGVGGLYDRGPTEDGVPIEVALSGPMFRRDPTLTWKYIADIEKAMRDGFSTGSGLGLGLGGAKRLSNEFEIESKPGVGTRVTITRWR